MTAIGIHQGALVVGPQQGLVGVLAVDVDQEVAQVLELAATRRSAIDEGARAALSHQQPAHDALAVIVQGLRGQPVSGRGAVGEIEAGDHLGAFLAGTDHGGIGLVPQGQAQGIDQDGFSGPGLAGQGGEAAVTVEFQAADDRQVLDEDVGQHGGCPRLGLGTRRSSGRAGVSCLTAWYGV